MTSQLALVEENNTKTEDSIGDKRLESATPMMQQYLKLKAEHPDVILFYRLGDFYELFFKDAEIGAAAMDIALTKRGQHLGEDIPMCGVPFHSYESYLEKLIKAGHKVAICEQTETPEEAKKRGGHKAVVTREVVRVITPGTVTEDNLLDARSASYLAACVFDKKDADKATLAWVDITSGEFTFRHICRGELNSELHRLQPKECLISDTFIDGNAALWQEWRSVFSTLSDNMFSSSRGEQRLQSYYEVETLSSFGDLTNTDKAALGVIIEYIDLTQKGEKPALRTPKQFHEGQHMLIDAATRRNLELHRSLNGERKGSLISVIDKTVTNTGARLLQQWLALPLLKVKEIQDRQNAIAWTLENKTTAQNIQRLLMQCPDIERALARLALSRGGPRDLVSIRTGLKSALDIAATLEPLREGLPAYLESALDQISFDDELYILLFNALKEEVPFLAREGGFIKQGFNATLDEWRDVIANSDEIKNELAEKYRKETGIDKLKIKENNVLGMFIETSPQYADKIPETYIHRQTLASAVRFSTSELRELESKRMHALENIFNLEIELYRELVSKVVSASQLLMQTANALASLDVVIGLGELAQDNNWIKPEITDSKDMHIKEGRHPVVEKGLSRSGESFIANNCDLDAKGNLWLLTGPNMAGKSTFLRQNAIIILLAQMGAYVPASDASIGVVDRLFSRVGAADDLARGHSTFMVEMMETATILNQSTDRSFVILDEIGRGTATFDGLSIAWATLEYLHNTIKCRTLFATHYHELTLLKDQLDKMQCHTMQVKEWKGEIVFLHHVIAGAADKSYGIHVAKLAGIPKQVTKRATAILEQLQAGDQKSAINQLADDIPLFTQNFAAEAPSSEVLDELEDINPDNLTPREAHALLYKLKELMD